MRNSATEIRYPIGIQTFSKIREEDWLYVDKTAFIYKLIQRSGYYFLSRPRRFGKSLFLSTLQSYFEGRRDLFKGLALDTLTDDWTPRPVLRVDLNTGLYLTKDNLIEVLKYQTDEWERKFNIPRPKEIAAEEVGLRFKNVIEKVWQSTGKKVVILIDEYDKPLLNSIGNDSLYEEYTAILKSFYSNMKTMDAYIEFAMLTGVARFGKVSVFSDLNNLRDISFEDEFASICGITDEEVDRCFRQGIAGLAERYGKDITTIREELRRRYDGYHFAEFSPYIYNPFSLMNVFAKRRFGNFWFDTGTPTFLAKAISRMGRPIKELIPARILQADLESAGLNTSGIIPALYQAGYLTIKDFNIEDCSYILDYPNEEVEESFLRCLLQAYAPEMTPGSGFSIPDFIECVRAGDPEKMMNKLQSLLSSIPYSEKGKSEDHFRSIVYILFELLGFFSGVERRTSDGRIDLNLETKDYVYLFEFKIDSNPEVAMSQIKHKKYWLPYTECGKRIYLIGANFDTSSGRLSGWLISER